MKINGRWLSLALLAALGCGGDDDAAGIQTTSDTSAIDAEPITFNELFDQFQPGCVRQDCHGGFLAQGGVGLDRLDDTYELLTTDGPLGSKNRPCGDRFVVPGDPDSSVLMMMLEGTCGSLMPPEARWDARRLASVRAWIRDGAPND